MLLNRRLMLQGSLGAIALSVTGCGRSKTVVVFKNQLPVPLSVNATAKGISFNKSNIQPGGTATESYTTKYPKGETAPISGTASAAGTTVDLATYNQVITAGKTNTFTVSLVGSTPTVTVVLS